DQMRERLLTLAEVRTDLPALDVRRLFGEDYDRIRLRRDALARFRKNEAAVRGLVEKFSDLARVRGELLARWTVLRTQRLAFEQAHEARLGGWRAVVTEQ